ncbi:MAG: hypothetical protein R3E73_03665 [Porticoccaceae bacterium]|nr:hypothetical protein [Pseudomonadales bacterium]MCP5172703.1 hypothetical protein [Pseudomonadales bacterium]MCP5302177.1 hypothetical protein [Pseudomonadales bacterium]
MTEETKRTLSSTSCDQTENASGADRRSFLIKAGIAAPLAILATSRPAWGDLTNQDFRCGISGLVSGNVSIAPGQDLCNGGFSPGYWGNKNGFPRWASLHDTPFCGAGGIFIHCSCSGDKVASYAGVTMGEIITNNTYSGSFGFHAVATYLNSLYVVNYAISTADVLNTVNTVMGTGSVTISGVSFDCKGVKDLFDSTY